MMPKRFHSGPATDHFDGVHFFVPGRPFVGSTRRLLKWQFGGGRAKWPSQWPSPFSDRPPKTVAGMRTALIGHASFLIQVSGINLLVDPVYSARVSPVSFAGPKRVNPPGIAFDDLPSIDAVLVSHGHYDHLDIATLRWLHRKHNPLMICPLGNDAVIAPALGGQSGIKALDWGQSIAVGQGVTVHIEPSYHWSARSMTDRLKQLWCSFVITSPAGTIYHIADTGYGDGRFSRDVAEKFGPIRLAHIPIGAYEPRWFMKDQHVNPEEAVMIFRDCGAMSAVGHHWGTFQLTNEAHDQPQKDLLTALAVAGIDPSRFQAFRPGQVWEGSSPK